MGLITSRELRDRLHVPSAPVPGTGHPLDHTLADQALTHQANSPGAPPATGRSAPSRSIMSVCSLRLMRTSGAPVGQGEEGKGGREGHEWVKGVQQGRQGVSAASREGWGQCIKRGRQGGRQGGEDDVKRASTLVGRVCVCQ